MITAAPDDTAGPYQRAEIESEGSCACERELSHRVV
jgi:hypothetical protein